MAAALIPLLPYIEDNPYTLGLTNLIAINAIVVLGPEPVHRLCRADLARACRVFRPGRLRFGGRHRGPSGCPPGRPCFWSPRWSAWSPWSSASRCCASPATIWPWPRLASTTCAHRPAAMGRGHGRAQRIRGHPGLGGGVSFDIRSAALSALGIHHGLPAAVPQSGAQRRRPGPGRPGRRRDGGGEPGRRHPRGQGQGLRALGRARVTGRQPVRPLLPTSARTPSASSPRRTWSSWSWSAAWAPSGARFSARPF
jgi:hypothetical protein